MIRDVESCISFVDLSQTKGKRSDKNRLKKPCRKTSESTRPQKGARQLKSRKLLRKTQGQASFLDRRVRNMENGRNPLNRRIRRYSILQQLNFGDTWLTFNGNRCAIGFWCVGRDLGHLYPVDFAFLLAFAVVSAFLPRKK